MNEDDKAYFEGEAQMIEEMQRMSDEARPTIERRRLQREKNAGAYMEPAPDGNWVTFSDHAAELARVEGERDILKSEVSMLSREVYRESQLRRKLEEMMKDHVEYLRDNRMLDDQARAATDAAGILKGAGT